MGRRLVVAGTVLITAAALANTGCSHNYEFVEIERGTSLYVNTSRTHYKIPINREDLERKLITLARYAKLPLEEKFVLDVGNEMCYEIGFGENSNKNDSEVLYSDQIFNHFAPGTNLIFYHTHMASFTKIEELNEERDLVAKLVDIMKKNKKKMEQLGKGVSPDYKKIDGFEQVLASDELFSRFMMLPQHATPSYTDFDSFVDSMIHARKRGHNFRYMIASPYGITEIILPAGGIIFNRKEVRQMKKRYKQFEKSARSGDNFNLLIDPVKEYDRLNDIADGYFAVIFRPAIKLGLPPYVHDYKSPGRHNP